MTDNPVREKSYAFALRIIELHRGLVASRELVLSKQVLRSGTAIGANVEEASAGQSKREFAAKMSIASKEARECHYWLRLIKDSELAPAAVVEPLLRDCHELIRLLTAIVKTAQTSVIKH